MLLSSRHASTLTLLVFILSDAPVFSDWLVSARVKNIREYPYEWLGKLDEAANYLSPGGEPIFRVSDAKIA